MSISITPEKKQFIQYIAGGLSTLMNCSMLSDEIYNDQDDENEVCIKDFILVGSSFCEHRFREALETLDDRTLEELFKYFDDRDMTISQAYIESSLVFDDLPEELHIYMESIDLNQVNTFRDFLQLS
tara:strand:- start:83 stop:463 length:381 start_codon:yes stop_codon:yes gene_type:complete